MSKIQDLYNKTLETKKEIRLMNQLIADTLTNDKYYQTLLEDYKTAGLRKREWQDQIKSGLTSELNQLETLKLDLENDKMLLADMALTKVQKGEEVIVEEKGKQLEIQFSVKFKK